MSVGDFSYLFVKNLQGDITKIVDDSGDIVATYAYDAWGKVLSTKNGNGQNITDQSSIAFLNPFRYRGYVYDTETQLYYLQSRYYDPVTGRFLNADTYTDTQSGTPLSTNMFAYCENEPVMLSDASGEDAWWIQATTDANGFGHTSLLIEWPKNFYWFFLWADQNVLLAPIGEYSGSMDSLKDTLSNNNYYKNKFDRQIYFKGNFKNSIVMIKKVMKIKGKLNKKTVYSCNSNNYIIFCRNCMQVSAYILMQGSFKNYDFYYKKILSSVLTCVMPNYAYMLLKKFQAELTIYTVKKSFYRIAHKYSIRW